MRNLALLVLLAVVAMVAAGCGGSSVVDSGPASILTPQYPPAPTVADLTAELSKGLDPSVPLDQKLSMFQGLQADPGLIQRAAKEVQKHGITVHVTKVVDNGSGELSVDVDFMMNGEPNSGTVPFVAEDGRWKVQKSWVCNLVAMADAKSPACP